jgi:hypothetical protein
VAGPPSPSPKSTRLAGAGDGGDAAVGAHSADATIARVGNPHAAVRGDHHRCWVVQLRLGRGTAVAGEARLAGAGERGDRAVGADPPNDLSFGISDQHAAVAGRRHAARTTEPRLGGGAAVAFKPQRRPRGGRRAS